MSVLFPKEQPPPPRPPTGCSLRAQIVPSPTSAWDCRWYTARSLNMSSSWVACGDPFARRPQCAGGPMTQKNNAQHAAA
jgi:hypothetical protein